MRIRRVVGSFYQALGPIKTYQRQQGKRDSMQIDLYSEKFFRQKLTYIHDNPVKAGLCALPEEYLYSSAKFHETGFDKWGLMNENTASRW